VPFANLIFFAAAAVVPSRKRDAEPEPERAPDRGLLTATLMSGAAGAVVALGMVGISVGLFRNYGAALFLGAPAISGHVATLFVCRLHGPRVGAAVLATTFALLISFVVMLISAVEGAVCLLMISPLAAVSALISSMIALAMVRLARSIATPTPTT